MEDDDRRGRGRGGAPPRPEQQPLSTDLANIVNAATSASNPRHPADLVRPAKREHRALTCAVVLAMAMDLPACAVPCSHDAVCADNGITYYRGLIEAAAAFELLLLSAWCSVNPAKCPSLLCRVHKR